VAELAWTARSPLEGVLSVARSGSLAGEAGVRLTELRGFVLLQVMARRGAWAATAQTANRLFGIAPPERPGAAFGDRATLIWSGPGQFMALIPDPGAAFADATIREAFAGAASVSDQSGGRCLVRISGANARDMLAKVCSLDLHPTAFPAGAAAATSIDHTNVLLWRGPETDGELAFNLLLPSSFATSLWRTLADSAAEYGLVSAVAPIHRPGAA
jgi:methylglutamate dehydrogenase subunit D